MVTDPPKAVIGLAECNKARVDARIQIDLFLLTIGKRDLYSQAEVMNILLDIRRKLL